MPVAHTTGAGATTTGAAGATTTAPGATTTGPLSGRHLPNSLRNHPGPQPPSTKMTSGVPAEGESGVTGRAPALPKETSESSIPAAVADNILVRVKLTSRCSG